LSPAPGIRLRTREHGWRHHRRFGLIPRAARRMVLACCERECASR